jgi:hypothetical protein
MPRSENVAMREAPELERPGVNRLGSVEYFWNW